jgi:thiamine transporter ThiT
MISAIVISFIGLLFLGMPISVMLAVVTAIVLAFFKGTPAHHH